MYGQESKLGITLTGHYVLQIVRPPSRKAVELVLFTGQASEIPKKVLKLHRQFAHPTADKLMRLIEEVGMLDEAWKQETQKVSDKCQICKKFKRTPAHPVVSLPIGREFNEAVGMDLKTSGSVYFLVMVDLATRYCVASVIANKR